jgi:CheY-specific phosphatase CheX
MNEINSLDLKTFITNAVRDVFDTMLSMTMENVAVDQIDQNGGKQLVGTVSFAGRVMGSVNLHVGKEFACEMTAGMLGMETDEIDSEEEVHDVIGEVCNMIGGDLKSRLCDSNLACELSIPSITSGKDFAIEPKGWARSEKYGFRSSRHTAKVEVFIKSGN